MNLNNVLNPAQLKAVQKKNVPLLVLAGAGSGKTRVITYRIAHLIQQGVYPSNILAVTFTNKAAEEMASRVQTLVDFDVNINIGTFHSVCVKILRIEAHNINLNPYFVIYDEYDQLSAIRSILKELNIDSKKFRPKSILHKISTAKNNLITAKAYEKNISNYYDELIYKIYIAYENLLQKSSALDFDDIILFTVKMFQKHHDILNKYQNKYKHILVDEYQDTNYAQYAFIRLLADKGHNLCIVGDPDQSIYRWRGADISNILNFTQDYSNVAIIPLEQNYRSTQKILTSANHVISNNTARKEKNLWTRNDSGEFINICECENEHEEADFITEKINKLKQHSEKKLSDIVVFYRTHAQSRILEETFRSSGIPYQIIGGVGFYERKEIKDILAYLKLMICPEDQLSLKRIINTPIRGIGKSSINTIAKLAKKNNTTFNELLISGNYNDKLPKRIRSKIEKFVSMISYLKEQSNNRDIANFIRLLINKTNYTEHLKKEDPHIAQTRIENIRELVSAAEEYEETHPECTLLEFIESISLSSDIDNWESTEKVSFMTLHSAKGLEFETVFMSGMEEGIFPHINSLNSLDELEEERRLCYVGMTRAKKNLFMSYTNRRMIYGRRINYMPSRFLSEIPDNLKEVTYFSESNYSTSTLIID